jgi:hypothetical protein
MSLAELPIPFFYFLGNWSRYDHYKSDVIVFTQKMVRCDYDASDVIQNNTNVNYLSCTRHSLEGFMDELTQSSLMTFYMIFVIIVSSLWGNQGAWRKSNLPSYKVSGRAKMQAQVAKCKGCTVTHCNNCFYSSDFSLCYSNLNLFSPQKNVKRKGEKERSKVWHFVKLIGSQI